VVASDLTIPTFSIAGLEPATTHYWKVVAKGDPFCVPLRSAASEVWSFTTANTCEAPSVPD
jgi:hypothetical protein